MAQGEQTGLRTGSVLEEITSDEYARLTGDRGPVFCRADFLTLNSGKVEKVRCFLLRDKKDRLAFAAGQRDGQWLAPFSAPFATVIGLREELELGYYWDFVQLLDACAQREQIRRISLFLPPDIYGSQQNAKLTNALLGNGYRLEYQELNYSLDLQVLRAESYAAGLSSRARNKLSNALRSGLSLVICQTRSQKEEAYEVIRQNRESKGYPLRMSLQQVLDTIEVVDHDFFLVQREGVSIAAAIVFHVYADQAQIIYWGDVPGVGEYKPVNYLAYELLKYYQERGFKELDIGPSTENGTPNFGLCSFKESIGCRVTSKLRLTKELAGGVTHYSLRGKRTTAYPLPWESAACRRCA